jgi:hypothetical protein
MCAVLARRAMALVLLVLAACTEAPIEPPAVLTPTDGDTSLVVNALAPAADAPEIANPVVTFYAKVDEATEAYMYYRPRPGRADSVDFVRFRVPPGSLLEHPGGSPFAPGDSILITISLVDPERLLVRFEPSGLRFDPAKPADLKFSFLETDEDRNQDGAVDADDAAILALVDIWKRESVLAPWIRQTSVMTIGSHEIETDVFGFTDYIIAW